jgi:hypothetical protein
MINVTNADVMWLGRLLIITEYIYQQYPELFNEEDEETLKIAGELIRSIKT